MTILHIGYRCGISFAGKEIPSVSTSKTSETYNALKSQLLNGGFAPREQLRIDAITSALAVSKGAVREALARLTSDGLVDNTPQKGFVVAPVSSADLIDLTEVRIELESRCLELAIARGDLAWEGRVLSAYHLLSHTRLEAEPGGVNPVWTERHDDFHDSLISACESRWRLRLRGVTYLQAERYRRMTRPKMLERRDVDSEHKAIMEATLQRNARLACQLMERHLRATMDLILGSGLFGADADGPELRTALKA
jgi:GntR family transcriptional regulator, carbon starvation induced regulator